MERSPKRITRQLRDRKERKFYTDDFIGDADDEIEGPQSFDLDEKLETTRFNKPLVKELKGSDFNLSYIQQHGFITPLIFKDKTGLGLRIPTPNFSVGDVKTLVGSKRMLDVMDVRTQKNLEMSMKQWQEYYDKTGKDRLLNVISLEFSHTKLENYIESPTVVRQLDWVDRVWPRHLKNMQTESTNVMDEMMYPKVQKYCLMSVKGCYTDFHVDFGGTSVWYHILKGAKVFWLIPPTDKNLELYQSWVLSGKQGDTFFGDNVEDCGRVYLQNGDTFFIPSGWIHAVYTPKDSLVFGGNFLHSFGIDKQLRIATVEEATKVPQKFRYPFFTEMLWYTLERYVHCLLGTSFIKIPHEEGGGNNPENSIDSKKLSPDGVHLSPQELLGLKSIVLYLHQLPIQRKNVPALIYDPVALLKSVRTIVEEHRYDNPEKAVTGLPILVWPAEKAEDVGKIQPHWETIKKKPLRNSTTSPGIEGSTNNTIPIEYDIMKRRVCCGVCLSCTTTEDCKSCSHCLTILKQQPKDIFSRRTICLMRECMKPLLQTTSACSECGLDGWGEVPQGPSGPLSSSMTGLKGTSIDKYGWTPGPSAFSSKPRTGTSSLMECSICYQITHPLCITSKASAKTIAIVDDDLPNSWECPICIEKLQPTRGSKKIKSPEGRRNSTDNDISNSASSSHRLHKVITNGTSGQTPLSSSVKSTNNNIVRDNSTPNLLSNISSMSSSAKNELPNLTIPKKEIIIDEKPKIDVDNKIKAKENKSMRDDEKQVQQKLAQVVRRKSIDDAALGKPIMRKINSSSKPPVLTPYSADPIITNRRLSSDAPKPNIKINGSNKFTSSIKRDVSPKAPPIIPIKKPKLEKESEDEEDLEDLEDDSAKKASHIKYPFRTELADKIMAASNKPLKKPSNVVRPAPIDTTEDDRRSNSFYWRDKEVLVNVFKLLDIKTMSRVLCVNKDWNRIGLTPCLWHRMDLTHRKITADLLKGCVRRQPFIVTLDWTNISKQQLLWFISRLPQLKELSLRGLSWNSVIALKTCMCPTLTGLDLGYVGGLTDAALREILAPPLDSRPGLTDSKSRLRQLKSLCLAGASLSDVSLRYVTQHAGSISKLDISTCSRITDAGIAQLGAPESPSLENLTSLNISGCPQLTNICLEHLRRCRSLKFLDIRHIPQITLPGLTKFLNQVNTGNLKMIVKCDFSSVSGPIGRTMTTVQPSTSASTTTTTTTSVGISQIGGGGGGGGIVHVGNSGTTA